MAVPSAKKGRDALGRRDFWRLMGTADTEGGVANCDNYETTSDLLRP